MTADVTATTRTPDHLPARPPVAEVQRLLAAELSLPSRLVYLFLLLVDLTVGIVVGSLWLTEQTLPTRTHIGFGGIVVGSLVWAVYFGWTLSRRKVLLARHRVVAGRIAVTFTSLFAIGCATLALTTPHLRPVGLAAGVFGAALAVIAWLLLLRARLRHDALVSDRGRLERALAGAP